MLETLKTQYWEPPGRPPGPLKSIRHYAASIEKLKKVTDPRPGEEIFGMTMITLKGKTILVADTNVQDFPTAERLVQVSKSCVRVARLFGFDPKVAFLSFFDNILSDKFTPRLPVPPSPRQTPKMIFLPK